MGNYENLKQSITEVIRTNGNKEITGAVLQSTLLTIISTVGANATFAGIATPTTNPGTPDGSVFYLASESGTYTNFNAIELQDGLSVLMWNGSWSSQQIFAIDDEPIAESKNLITSGAVSVIAQSQKQLQKSSLYYNQIKEVCTNNYYYDNNLVKRTDGGKTLSSDFIDISLVESVKTNGVNVLASVLYFSDKNINSFISADFASETSSWSVYYGLNEIPSGAKYIIIQVNIDSGALYTNDFGVFYQSHLAERLETIWKSSGYYINIKEICTKGFYYDQNRVKHTDGGETRSSDFIDVSIIKKLKTNGVSSLPSIMYFSAKSIDSFISSEFASETNNWGIYDKAPTIPSGAKYAIVQVNTNPGARYNDTFGILYDSYLSQKLNELDDNVEDTNSRLNNINTDLHNVIKSSAFFNQIKEICINDYFYNQNIVKRTDEGVTKCSDFISVDYLKRVRTNGVNTLPSVMFFTEKSISSFISAIYASETNTWGVYDGEPEIPNGAKYFIVQVNTDPYALYTDSFGLYYNSHLYNVIEAQNISINTQYRYIITSFDYTEMVLMLLGSNDLQSMHVISKNAYKPNLGRKTLRDPSPIRIGQYYYITYTVQDWSSGNTIGMCRTRDFVNYEELPQLQITQEGTAISNTNVWAPCWFEDGLNRYILVNVKLNGEFKTYYCIYNEENHTITDIELLNLPYNGGKVIDTHLCKENGYYYAIYKDENGTSSTLHIAKSSSINGNFVEISSNLQEVAGYSEGPCVFRLDNGKIRVVYQNLHDTGYPLEFTDGDSMEETVWTPAQRFVYSEQLNKPSHPDGLDKCNFGTGFGTPNK